MARRLNAGRKGQEEKMEAQEQGTTVEVRGRFRPVRRRFLFSLGIFLLTGGVGLIGYAHEQQKAAFGKPPDWTPLIVWLGSDPFDQYFAPDPNHPPLPSRRIYAAGIAFASVGAFLVAFQAFPLMGRSPGEQKERID